MDPLDLVRRWHQAVPAGCRFPEVCYNLPGLWSQFHFTIPAALGEIPQGIGEPDGWRVLWFGWTHPKEDEVSQGRYRHTLKRGFARKDLEKAHIRVANSNGPARIPGK